MTGLDEPRAAIGADAVSPARSPIPEDERVLLGHGSRRAAVRRADRATSSRRRSAAAAPGGRSTTPPSSQVGGERRGVHDRLVRRHAAFFPGGDIGELAVNGTSTTSR